jgi:hypothetical protein
MPRALIMFGLGLIAAWVLLRLTSMVMDIAPYAGGLLVVIGVVWHYLERSAKKR